MFSFLGLLLPPPAPPPLPLPPSEHNSLRRVRFSNSLSLLGFLHNTARGVSPLLRDAAACVTAAYTELVGWYLLLSLLEM